MRARQRHLNKSLRDTACAFDSRFLSGFSDGNEVDTWTDLSANARNATQSTSANRPLYKTAIQGGNPVVRFDGSNDVLTTASFDSPSSVSAIMVAKADAWTSPTSFYRSLAAHGYGTGVPETSGIALCYLAYANVIDWQVGDLMSWGSGYQNTSNPRAIGPTSSGSNFRIVSTVFWPSLSRMYVNGVQTSTRKETTGTIAAFTRIFYIGSSGESVSRYWVGDIAAVIYFPSNIGEPMRARIERSNALAFKIACS
jgi:hypothetical protein